MKKKISGLCLLTLLFSSTLFAEESKDPTPVSPVTVNGGTIKFSGSLVNAACSVEQPTDGMIVDLQQTRIADLKTIGAVTPAKDFIIKLTDCSADTYKKASVKFIGKTAGGKNTTLAIEDGAAAASGVGVQILSAGKAVPVDGSASSDSTNLMPGESKMLFRAQYVATDANAKPGKANASADFTITYQ